MDKKVQAKNITDDRFMALVDELSCKGSVWVMHWDLVERLGLPSKVVRAKAASLIRRGILDGCTCGCRGDFRRPG